MSWFLTVCISFRRGKNGYEVITNFQAVQSLKQCHSWLEMSASTYLLRKPSFSHLPVLSSSHQAKMQLSFDEDFRVLCRGQTNEGHDRCPKNSRKQQKNWTCICKNGNEVTGVGEGRQSLWRMGLQTKAVGTQNKPINWEAAKQNWQSWYRSHGNPLRSGTSNVVPFRFLMFVCTKHKNSIDPLFVQILGFVHSNLTRFFLTLSRFQKCPKS